LIGAVSKMKAASDKSAGKFWRSLYWAQDSGLGRWAGLKPSFEHF
jgi:hypothetical protein